MAKSCTGDAWPKVWTPEGMTMSCPSARDTQRKDAPEGNSTLATQHVQWTHFENLPAKVTASVPAIQMQNQPWAFRVASDQFSASGSLVAREAHIMGPGAGANAKVPVWNQLTNYEWFTLGPTQAKPCTGHLKQELLQHFLRMLSLPVSATAGTCPSTLQ